MKRAATDELYDRVAAVWRAGGRTPGTIYQYMIWVRRFRGRFADRGDVDGEMLTRDRVDAFAAAYVTSRRCNAFHARSGARNALRAWSCAVHTLGFDVPPWICPAPPPPQPPMFASFMGA